MTTTADETVAVRLDELRRYGADAAIAASLYRTQGTADPEPVAVAMGMRTFGARLLWTHLRRRGWVLDAPAPTDTPAPAGRTAAPRGNRNPDPRVGEGRTA